MPRMSFRDKLIPWLELSTWRSALRDRGKTLVVTNGCFDLLHLGHVAYLEAARAHGDVLLVGINSDASVRALKGPERPINPESDRAAVVAALQSVDAVCIFEDRSALRFLSAARPDLWVKGGDYTLETIDQDERQAIEAVGGRVVLIPLVPGKSTTRLLGMIAKL
jgi:D-glycero-beta-D-manno-heptose 1-phosphate adenylyltransferase